MAFFLTPRFAPAYTAQQCNPWACAPRPQYSYHRVVRPSFPSFAPFLGEFDELLSALDHEARREAHRQRQQRKRIVRAHFNVQENNEGYQVDAEIPGFKQEHIEIEVTDENTLKLSGNTERKAEQPQPQPTEAAPEAQTIEPEAQSESMEGVTLNEPEEASTSGAATPTHSDTESHKSYRATVEDDFEDLSAETSSTLSAHSEAPKEPKGKEKAVEEPTATTETAIQPQPQPEAPAQQQPQPENEEWEFHGAFERTFKFPERIDAVNVKASLRNGLLSIAVPKAKAPTVRRVLIE